MKQPIQGDINRDYFDYADKERFFWLTENKFISANEKKLLENIKINPNDAVLEIGCGEGANIYNLNGSAAIFAAADLSYEKLRFAKSFIKKAKFICADAAMLPFCDNYFDLVFCKDVFHHVQDKDKMIREMARVLKPKKAIVILEANGRNLIWSLFGTFIRQEKGVKRSTRDYFKLFLERHKDDFCKISISYLDYPMLSRLITHYKFGLKKIGNNCFFASFSKCLLKYSMPFRFENLSPYLFILAVKN